MNNQIILLILGMTAVTYIPRLLPFLMLSQNNIPIRLRRFLKYIPYTALGALIIPGVFSATPQMPYAAGVGMVFAFIFGWVRGGIILPVFGAVFVTFIMLLAQEGLFL